MASCGSILCRSAGRTQAIRSERALFCPPYELRLLSLAYVLELDSTIDSSHAYASLP